jgi:hypothetical protein
MIPPQNRIIKDWYRPCFNLGRSATLKRAGMGERMENKVISIFEAKKSKGTPQVAPKVEKAGDFEIIQKENALKNEKLREERAKANQAVLKSYKLKEKEI